MEKIERCGAAGPRPAPAQLDSFKESRKEEEKIALFFNSSENFNREQYNPTAATGGREIIEQRLLLTINIEGR